jgi:Polysaccharide lyase 14
MRPRTILGAALAIAVGLLPADAVSPTHPDGIEQKYPNDAGIAGDPRVIFADNFDAWETDTAKVPPGTWDAVRNSNVPNQRQTLVVAGAVTVDGKDLPGKNVLKLACYHGSPNSAGLRKHLGNYRNADEGKGPGYEEVYIRYYQKLDDAYTPERNHGANLGGRDLTRPGSWSVGRANTRDVAANGYFYSGLQPYPDSRAGKMHWGFYSYHLDKRDQWGDDYRPKPDEKKPIQVGRWYCLERHMKLNSVGPLKADGVEEVWVDGELAIRRDGLRFRRVPEVRITVFELEVYYHGLPEKFTAEKPIKVYFDNVVIAKERIGCLSPARP